MSCIQFPILPTTINSFYSTHMKNNFLSLSTSSSSRCKLIHAPNYDFPSRLPKYRLAEQQTICAAIGVDKSKNQIELPQGLEPELVPKHVAIVADGNRRWAIDRGLPVQLGYKAGGKVLKQVTLNSMKLGVRILTFFAFSTENWNRPKEEVGFLMNFFEEVALSDIKDLIQENVRLSILGDRGQLPESLQRLVSSSLERVKDNRGLHLVIALNYSGRYDITEASREIARKVKHGILQVEDINETVFEQHLQTIGIEFPNPDLLIRTSGELRLSNFMLWQLAYTELYFTHKLFPDFNEEDLLEALVAFQRRQRRFGGHKY